MEIRMLAAMLLEAEGSTGEDALEAGNPAEVTRRHDLDVRSLATELAGTPHLSVQTAEARLGEAWTLSNELFDTLSAASTGAEASHLTSCTRTPPSGAV